MTPGKNIFALTCGYKPSQQVGLDAAFYTHRERPIDEVFPWEHISTSVRKKYLTEDYLWSLQGKTRVDCRQQCYACGILPTFADLRREHPGEIWQCPEVSSRRIPISQIKEAAPITTGAPEMAATSKAGTDAPCACD